MNYSIKSGTPEKQRVGCVIVGVYEHRKLSPAAEAIDRASDGVLRAALQHGDLDGKSGQTLLLHCASKVLCKRVLLVGLGRERDFDESAYRKACTAAIRALRSTGARDAHSYLTHLEVKNRNLHWNVRQAVWAAQNELYRFNACHGTGSKEKLPDLNLKRLFFDVPHHSNLPVAERALTEACAINAGATLAKNLGNLPGNICTPTYLAQQARLLARQHKGIRCKVLEQKDMEKLGMGALLSVARGSRQPPKLIVLEYRHGTRDQKPVALVGKGLTFDAGGISLKPADKMDEMKFDMCGGAAVLGAFKAIAELKLPLNLVGVIPCSENLPDGQANKPGDIVTSMAGITIEVLNTDAEGRLILCDALTYVEKHYAPSVCVDIATLTGACVVALGGHASGLFSNTPTLARALLEAGDETGDRAWQLPLWEDYQPMLKSEHADVANVSGGRDAGAITAACFLHRFTRKMKWAHLDVAGTAWKGKRATGRPVPLLTQYLIKTSSEKPAKRNDAH
ncbi:MAG: leucyl aminopeptidase [Nevskiales bacterium]|nr:leucyl aminopeptidase [Nevskiales bacterium]